jgi:hypothetical protein
MGITISPILEKVTITKPPDAQDRTSYTEALDRN